ncbi:MAG TPA: YjgN family protein [bacterium]|nr:YjgN family protein [bacterium]
MALSDQPRKFSFYGQGGTLFGMHLVNLFLGLVTLGLYFFWGRVKIRKYLWGQMEFEGDRFSYHGTGKETLLGWLKAMLFFGIPYLAAGKLPQLLGADKILIVVGALFSALLFLLFIPMAVIGSRRYRLSRTSWRGIRFSFRESWKHYFGLFIAGNILIVLTLGLFTPFYSARRDKFLISNSFVGNQNFEYDGKGGDLFGSYALALILAIPTLFLSMLWYHVKRTVYLWGHTSIAGARFQSTVTFGGMFKLYLVNFLMVLFTLGFAYPWAQVRAIRYTLDHLTLNGPVDLDAIQQDAQAVTATGEELASFLELDFDLG